MLLYDDVLVETPGETLFPVGSAAAASAWRANRAELLAEFTLAGRRPAAFWRYDVGIDPPTKWWEETGRLEELGLLTREEEIRVERERKELSGDQGELYDAIFAWKDWGAYMYQRFAGAFTFAAGWHGRRGRPELEAKYEALAQQAKTALEAGEAPCRMN